MEAVRVALIAVLVSSMAWGSTGPALLPDGSVDPQELRAIPVPRSNLATITPNPDDFRLIEVPPGVYFTQAGITNLAAQIKVLEDQNKNLGESIASRPPGISVRGLITVLLVGAALGAAVALGGRALVDSFTPKN